MAQIAGVALHLVALLWSLALLARARDWRFTLLSGFLGVMVVRESLDLVPAGVLPPSLGPGAVGDFPAVAVGLVAVVAVYALERVTAERARAAQALRESEIRFRTIFETSRDAIFETGRDGEILLANPAMHRLFGSPAEDVAGRRVSDFIADPADWVQLHAAMAATGYVDGYEIRIRGRDGHERIGLVTATACHDQDGRFAGCRGSVRDVTEERRLREQLFSAQRLETIGRLAGGVAHDFNNLLTVILGQCGLLLHSLPHGDPLRTEVLEIQAAGTRAAALTRQLLAFARRQHLQPRILDLNAVIAELQAMIRRLIGEGVRVVTTLAPDLARVRADPAQIEQIILNLVANARDAMPQGGTLTIETMNVELDNAYVRRHLGVEPGSYVLLAVSDTGHGMDAETLAHVFEPFFTTKERGGGTGLGLASVYGIVKQSGGYVWAYSEPGLGATFKVYLPRAEGEPTPRGPEPAQEAVPRGTETILVVEDDQAVRTLITRILEHYGYHALAAAEGAGALELARAYEGPIHLLLTDVVLSDIAGAEVARRLRAERPGLRTLYTSGYTNDAAAARGLLHAGAHFLQKPITPEALARKVREILDAPSTPAPGPEGSDSP